LRLAPFLLPVLLSAGALALTPEQRQQNLSSFDYVWNTVRNKHWDQTLGGLDWDKVRRELRPRVEHAETDEEVRALISEMLARLHQSHFAVIPGSVYHDVEQPAAAARNATVASVPAPATPDEASGSVGFDIRVLGGEAVVSSVEEGSSAAKQGVRPGWIVRSIGGADLGPSLARVSRTYEDSSLRDMMLARVVTSRLEGPVEQSISIEFQDAHDQPRRLSIQRQTPRGNPAKFGYLPSSNVWLDARRINSDVEYIAFNYFLDPTRLIPAFQGAVRGCSPCSGVVIDLRGNPGGIGILAMGIAGYFIEKPDQKLGIMRMRDLPLKFVVNPRPPVFSGPLAILIDGLSASTSEIFAGGMQDLHRARVFGTRSAGAALPSMIERLPNGDGFQYAAATYQSESGRTLEGAGVTPDEITPLTRAALLAGGDPALDAAVQWIYKQQKGTSQTP
jgi:carboxyl-terminal processing protease